MHFAFAVAHAEHAAPHFAVGSLALSGELSAVVGFVMLANHHHMIRQSERRRASTQLQ